MPTMHDVFWFVIFPTNAFALGLCLGRYLTETGVVPLKWPFGKKYRADIQ